MFCPKKDYLIVKILKYMIYIICQRFDIYNYFEHVMEILLDISERIIKKKKLFI